MMTAVKLEPAPSGTPSRVTTSATTTPSRPPITNIMLCMRLVWCESQTLNINIHMTRIKDTPRAIIIYVSKTKRQSVWFIHSRDSLIVIAYPYPVSKVSKREKPQNVYYAMHTKVSINIPCRYFAKLMYALQLASAFC